MASKNRIKKLTGRAMVYLNGGAGGVHTREEAMAARLRGEQAAFGELSPRSER